MDALSRELAERLQRRPGRALQLPGAALREAAVVAPLRIRGGEPSLLFTKRPDHFRRHAGQISFPGGVRDPEDRTPLHTALRELHEELGVAEDQVEVLGMLDEIPTITEFRVVPFVGLLPPELRLVPCPDEIAELLEVPVAALMAKENQRTERRFVRGAERDVYFFDHAGRTIWGATARILKNLLELLSDLPAWQALARA